jgi:hypothetical protein
MALAGLLVAVLAAKGVDALDAPWIAQKERRVQALARDLGPLLSPAATVQVMDTTGGGIHALLRLGLRQPTRFLYDFHFFHDVGDRRIGALRAEFVAGLQAGRPAAIVVFQDDWLRHDYERLAEWPEMEALVREGYRLAVEGDGYRVYAERRRP